MEPALRNTDRFDTAFFDPGKAEISPLKHHLLAGLGCYEYSTLIYRGKVYEYNFEKVALFLDYFRHSLHTLCKECNLEWTDKKLHSYTITVITKLKRLRLVSVGVTEERWGLNPHYLLPF